MNLPGNEVSIYSWKNTISEETRKKLQAKVFPSGSVRFPKIGAAIATNKKRMLVIPSCLDNNVMAIAPGIGSDSGYLYGLMLHKNISDFASDADPPSMRRTTVENWLMPRRPLSRQRRYAESLCSVRDLTGLADLQRTTATLSVSLMSHFLELEDAA